MKITLTDRFQQDAKTLYDRERERLFVVIKKLPGALQNPHTHTGVGIRKIHPSGIFEARIGLGLRAIFGLKTQGIVLHRIGSHDEIRRYLKEL